MTIATMTCTARKIGGGPCSGTEFEETTMPPEVNLHHIREAVRRDEPPATPKHRRYLCKKCGMKYRVNIEEKETP